jgi:Fic family protein
MSEVLEMEAGGVPANFTQPKREDVEEILNYRATLSFAAKALQDRPLSLHLLREAHGMLTRGVRGQDKSPGAFRSEQNWVGARDCPMEQANFIPIAQEHLSSGLEQWINYVLSRDEPDALVQLAVIHVEFEALHPFKDGNGRLGRMLIPLFLYSRKLLREPKFFMSGYLEAKREEYVQAMRRVSRDREWTDWCVFFLQGLVVQAAENQNKANAILSLYQRMLTEIPKLTHSQFSVLIIDFIFSQPIFASASFINASKIPRPSALRFLTTLRDGGILRVIRKGAGRRPTIYAFAELVSIAEGKAAA